MANYDINLNVTATANFTDVQKKLAALSREQQKAAASNRSVPVAQSGGAQRVIQQQGTSGAAAAGRVAAAEVVVQQQQASVLGIDGPDVKNAQREASARLRNQLKSLGIDDKEIKNAVSRFQNAFRKTLAEATAAVQATPRQASATAAKIYNEQVAASGVSGIPQAQTQRARDLVKEVQASQSAGVTSRVNDLQARQDAAKSRRQDDSVRAAEVEKARLLREENRRRRAAGQAVDRTSVSGDGGRGGRPPKPPVGAASDDDDFFFGPGGEEDNRSPYEKAADRARKEASSSADILQNVLGGDSEGLVDSQALVRAVQTYIAALTDAAAGLRIQQEGLEASIAQANASATLYSQQLLNAQLGIQNASRETIQALSQGRVLKAQEGALVADELALSPEFADAQARQRVANERIASAVKEQQLALGAAPEDVLSRQERIASGRLGAGDEAYIARSQQAGLRDLTGGLQAAVTLDPTSARERVSGLQTQLDAYEADLRTAETLVINDDAARAKIQALIQQAQTLRTVLADLSGLYAAGTPSAAALTSALAPIGTQKTPPPTPNESADALKQRRQEELAASRAQRRIPAGEEGAGQFIPGSQFIDDLGQADAIQQYISALRAAASAFASANSNFTSKIAEAQAQVQEYKAQVQNQTNQLLNASPEFIQGQAEASVLRSERGAAVGAAVQADPELARREAQAQADRQEVLRQQREAVVEEAKRRNIPPEDLKKEQRQALFAQGVPSLTGVEEAQYAAAQGREISRLQKSAGRAVFELDPTTAFQSLGEIDGQLTRLEQDLIDNKLIINDAAARATIEADIQKVQQLKNVLAQARAELSNQGGPNPSVLRGLFGISEKSIFKDIASDLSAEQRSIQNIQKLDLTDPVERSAADNALVQSQQRLSDLRAQADALAGPGNQNLTSKEAIAEYQRLQLEISKAERAQNQLAAAIANPKIVNALQRTRALSAEASKDLQLAARISRQSDPNARATQLARLKANIAALEQSKIDIETSVDPRAARELGRLEIKIAQLQGAVVDIEAGRIVGPGRGGPGGGGGGGGGGGRSPASPGGPSERKDIFQRTRERGGAAGFFGGGLLSTIRYGLPSLLFYGAISGIGGAINEAEEFQFNLTKIESQLNATFGEQGPQVLDRFKQRIIDLSQETGLAADEITRLDTQLIGAFAEAETVGQGGPRPVGVDPITFVEQQSAAAAKLAQVTGLPLNEITDGLTAASFAFESSFEDIGNVAIKLESQTGTLARETISFIGDIAPVAQEAGFSLEEFSSIAAIAQQRSGRSGAALAESFGRIIPRLRESRVEIAQIAAQSPGAFDGEFFTALENQDPRGILLGIGEAYDELDQKTRDQLNIVLGGPREAQTLVAALVQGEKILELSRGAADSAGVLDERFAKVQETLTVSLQRLAETAREFVLILLESGLEDLLQALISGATLLLNFLKGILSSTQGINDSLAGLPGFLAAGAASAFLLLRAFRGIQATGVISAITGFGARGGRGGGAAGGAGGRLSGLSSFFFTGGGLGAQRAAQQQYQQAQSMGIPVPTGAGSSGAARAAAGVGKFGRPLLGAGRPLLGASVSGGGAALALTAAYMGLSAIPFGGKDNAGLFDVGEARSQAAEAMSGFEESIAGLRFAATQGGRLQGLEGLDAEIAALESSPVLEGGDNLGVQIGAFLSGQQTPYDRLKDILQEAKDKRTADALLLVEANSSVQETFNKTKEDSLKILEGGTDEPYLKSSAMEEYLRQNPAANIDEVRRLGLVDETDLRYETGNKDLDSILNEFVIARGESSEAVLKLLSEGDGNTLESLKAAAAGGDELAGQLLNYLTEQDFFNVGVVNLAKEKQKADGELRVKIEALEADLPKLEDAARQFQAGSINWKAFANVVETTYKNAADIVQDTLARGEEATAFLEVLSARGQELAQAYDSVISSLIQQTQNVQTLLGGQTTEDIVSAQNLSLLALGAAATNPAISGAKSAEYARQIIEIQRSQQATLLSAADSAAEVFEILNQGIDIPISAKIGLVKSSLELIGINWALFNQQFQQFFSFSADAYLNTVLVAANGSVEVARQIIIDQINLRNAFLQKRKQTQATLVALFGQGWAGPNAKITQEIIKGEQENLLLFYTLLGLDASGNIDQARNDIEAARKTLQARANERKSRTGSPLAQADIDISTAEEQLALAKQTTEDLDDDRDAVAAINNANRAKRQVLKNIADGQRGIAKAFLDFIGDSIGSSIKELEQADADLAFAQAEGDEVAIQQAIQNQIAARKAIREALIRRAELNSQLAGAQTEDPLAQAQIELDFAKKIESLALSEEQRIQAQLKIIEANKRVEEAMRNIREAQFNVRRAELDAIEDSVGAAQLEVSRARSVLNDAVARNLGTAAIENARAGVIAAEKGARDAIFQDRMDDYKFLLDMGEITQSQYADYLEGLKSTLIPGTKQFRDLEVTIKQLRDDIGGNLQANLPTSLQLPTLYEVRRLNQMGQGAAAGQAIGYQDNRNVQVTVYVNNGMTEDQVVGTLSKAMNVGTTGLESRRY
jgi:hypothetical protein